MKIRSKTFHIVIGTKWISVYKRFQVQVLKAVVMKFRVFWEVAPFSHVEGDRRFRGAFCLHHQGDE
jgi:hypothetical protein